MLILMIGLAIAGKDKKQSEKNAPQQRTRQLLKAQNLANLNSAYRYSAVQRKSGAEKGVAKDEDVTRQSLLDKIRPAIQEDDEQSLFSVAGLSLQSINQQNEESKQKGNQVDETSLTLINFEHIGLDKKKPTAKELDHQREKMKVMAIEFRSTTSNNFKPIFSRSVNYKSFVMILGGLADLFDFGTIDSEFYKKSIVFVNEYKKYMNNLELVSKEIDKSSADYLIISREIFLEFSEAILELGECAEKRTKSVKLTHDQELYTLVHNNLTLVRKMLNKREVYNHGIDNVSEKIVAKPNLKLFLVAEANKYLYKSVLIQKVVGKSSLKTPIRNIYKHLKYLLSSDKYDYVTIGLLTPIMKSVVAMFTRFSEKLKLSGNFEKTILSFELRHYNDLRSKLITCDNRLRAKEEYDDIAGTVEKLLVGLTTFSFDNEEAFEVISVKDKKHGELEMSAFALYEKKCNENVPVPHIEYQIGNLVRNSKLVSLAKNFIDNLEKLIVDHPLIVFYDAKLKEFKNELVDMLDKGDYNSNGSVVSFRRYQAENVSNVQNILKLIEISIVDFTKYHIYDALNQSIVFLLAYLKVLIKNKQTIQQEGWVREYSDNNIDNTSFSIKIAKSEEEHNTPQLQEKGIVKPIMILKDQIQSDYQLNKSDLADESRNERVSMWTIDNSSLDLDVDSVMDKKIRFDTSLQVETTPEQVIKLFGTELAPSVSGNVNLQNFSPLFRTVKRFLSDSEKYMKDKTVALNLEKVTIALAILFENPDLEIYENADSLNLIYRLSHGNVQILRTQLYQLFSALSSKNKKKNEFFTKVENRFKQIVFYMMMLDVQDNQVLETIELFFDQNGKISNEVSYEEKCVEFANFTASVSNNTAVRQKIVNFLSNVDNSVFAVRHSRLESHLALSLGHLYHYVDKGICKVNSALKVNDVVNKAGDMMTTSFFTSMGERAGSNSFEMSLAGELNNLLQTVISQISFHDDEYVLGNASIESITTYVTYLSSLYTEDNFYIEYYPYTEPLSQSLRFDNSSYNEQKNDIAEALIGPISQKLFDIGEIQRNDSANGHLNSIKRKESYHDDEDNEDSQLLELFESDNHKRNEIHQEEQMQFSDSVKEMSSNRKIYPIEFSDPADIEEMDHSPKEDKRSILYSLLKKQENNPAHSPKKDKKSMLYSLLNKEENRPDHSEDIQLDDSLLQDQSPSISYDNNVNQLQKDDIMQKRADLISELSKLPQNPSAANSSKILKYSLLVSDSIKDLLSVNNDDNKIDLDEDLLQDLNDIAKIVTKINESLGNNDKDILDVMHDKNEFGPLRELLESDLEKLNNRNNSGELSQVIQNLGLIIESIDPDNSVSQDMINITPSKRISAAEAEKDFIPEQFEIQQNGRKLIKVLLVVRVDLCSKCVNDNQLVNWIQTCKIQN